MNSRIAKVIYKFLLGTFSVAALLVSGVYAVKISDVVLKHYWDTTNNKAWIGGDYYELTFKITPESGETIYAVDIAWKTNSGTTDATGSNKNCTIKLGGNEVDKCTKGQTCTVTCNIDLSQISQGTEYYLVVRFDMDNDNSGTDIGDVKADRIYYWKKIDFKRLLSSINNLIDPIELKFKVHINSSNNKIIIYGADIIWENESGGSGDITRPNQKCTIDDIEGNSNNVCEPGETCIIKCNAYLKESGIPIGEGEYYLIIGLDTNNSVDTVEIGDVGAEVVFYFKNNIVWGILTGSATSIEFNVSLSSGSGKAIHGVNVALINVYDGSKVSEVTCSIDDGKGGNTCDEGENCKITCNINLTQVSGSGIEYYLVAKFDIDGDGNADVEYYWRTSDQKLVNNVNEATTIVGDRAAPETRASATTTDGSSYTSDTWTNKDVTVTLTATDSESGVAETRYTIRDGDSDCSSLSYSDLDQPYSDPIEITADSEETVIKTICYASKDRVGNEESIKKLKKFVVKIDKESPQITPNIPSYISNSNRISAKVTDQGSGVKEVKIQIYYEENGKKYYWSDSDNNWVNEEKWLDMTYSENEGKYVYELTNVKLEDGKQYKIKIKAVDNVNNENIVERQTTADKSEPTVNFNYGSYTTGTWTNNDVSVTVTVNDALSGVQTKEYAIVQPGTTCNNSLSYTSLPEDNVVTVSEEGKWIICIHAVDNVGNDIYTSSNEIWIDKTKPTVNIDTPANGSHKRGIITIQITAQDSLSGINKVEVYVDSTKVGDATYNTTSGKYEYSLNTTKYSDGYYTIKVRAYDSAGNSKETTVTINIDNTQPRLEKVIQLNLTYVKLIFSEEVKSNDNVEITVSGIKVWENGQIKEEQATITCGQISGTEAVCTIDKPLTSGVSFTVSQGTITDRAGNNLDTSSVEVENAADILFKIPTNRWTYIALEYEIDTDYKLYKEFMNTTEGSILTYIGNWISTTLQHPLIGYVIKIESNDSSEYYLPVKYKNELSNNVKMIQLPKGWNLIAVVGNSTTAKNNKIDTFGYANETSLESLAVLQGQRDYKFAWIVNTLTGEFRPGDSRDNLKNWVRDYTPYWIYMLEEVVYTAPIAFPSPQ